MDVTELTRDELRELKDDFFWGEETNGFETYDFPDDIPDDVIFEHYSGICFVEEDFFCNIPQRI